MHRALAILICLAAAASAHSQEAVNLFPGNLDAFRGPKLGDWFATDEVTLDLANPKLLAAKPGKGPIWVNGAKGRTNDLYTKDKFGDALVHLEFVMAKGSNSGIKLHGHYEVQICDSFGKAAEKIDGSDCGGIYPRAEINKGYRHIDHGIAPKTNACKAPGEWQTLDIAFTAPRFDKEGKKSASARINVTLNGTLIHDDVELKTPTGDRWKNAEMAEGPIMIQGDHGPVAFRNVTVRKK